jgi:hypothetical protein
VKTTPRARAVSAVAALVGALLLLSGCASFSMTGEELGRAFDGSKATFRTYDKTGNVMDDVTGTSIRVTRDETFDERNGESTDKGSVILVQVGTQEIRHVGSTATLIEDGIDVIVPAQQGEKVESTEDATPFIQKLLAGHENVWKGSAKTVLVRTQDDIPVAVFSGDEVELFKPDIPSATAIRVVGTDGEARYALVYRANLTIYDTGLISPGS